MALESGFTSIEADIYLHGGELKVAHLPLALSSRKNLEDLYLKPLEKIIWQNGGTVYPNYPVQIVLMIDLKQRADKIYPALRELLCRYRSMISWYKDGVEVSRGPVRVLLSGQVSLQLLKEDTLQPAMADVQVALLNDTTYTKVINRYSSPWERYFKWKGRGEFPKHEQTILDSLVSAAHRAGKDIRFYHIPDKPSVWKVLLDSNVDWINTDHPARFSKFYYEVYRR
ncbi:MAG: hypothetical protein NZM35_01325 [Chitinophagales bacterium]|nr:hypothetical protein [Chitinophagales bacterium]MDW8419722.1 hypothetical protein [Chitinophagales bacterium]